MLLILIEPYSENVLPISVGWYQFDCEKVDLHNKVDIVYTCIYVPRDLSSLTKTNFRRF